MKYQRTLTAFFGTTLLLFFVGLWPTTTTAVGGNAQDTAGSSQGAIEDAWIDGKLEATLLFNTHLNSFDINTEVIDGVAYLNGAVESDIDRDLAGEIAKSIKGVKKVENDLVVDSAKAQARNDSSAYADKQSFKQAVKDATLTASVKSKLLLNNNTSGMAINVDSNNGVVTLTGEVGSAEEKELAVRIAGNTDGAVSVEDHLTVQKAKQKA